MLETARGESFGKGKGPHQSPGRTLYLDTRMCVPGDLGGGTCRAQCREDEEGVRKWYDTGDLPGQRGIQVNQCFLSISAFICLSCFQSSNRAERHMAKCLSRGIIIRKLGGKDKETLNSVPQE